jgi:hypothetical protein
VEKEIDVTQVAQLKPGQEAAKPLNIYQRLNEVRKLVAYVQKDKKVGEGGYLAVTHDAVTSLVREHFVSQGILLVPNLVSSSVVLTGTVTAKGTPFIRYEARYKFDVVNADDPQDKFAVEIESHAIDQGDKAPGKALSYAKKYVVLKLLEIESGEEEEDRQEQKPVEKMSKITPNAGAGDELTNARKSRCADIAIEAKDYLNEGKEWDAYQSLETAKLEMDEKLYIWTLFNSKERAALKRMQKAEYDQAARKEAART